MYMVYAVENEGWRENGMKNAFRGLGQLRWCDRIYRQGDCTIEIWRLEFDECTPAFLARIRRSLDAWCPYEYPLLLEVLETDCPELRRMLDMPDPVKPSLSWCIRRYKEYHSGRWDTYWLARGACLTAPLDFLIFLEKKGAVSREQVQSEYARVVSVFLGDPRYATPDFPTEVHEVLQVGRIVIDWTARQYPWYKARGYDPIPVPLVWINETGEDQVFAPPKKPSRAAV